MAEVAPYPWEALDRVSHATADGVRKARRAVRRRADTRAASAALGELTGAEVEIVIRGIEASSAPRRIGADVCLDVGDHTEVVVSVEPELGAYVLSRIVRRKVTLSASGAPLDPTLDGALMAVAVEVARRSGAHRAVTPRRSAPTSASGIDIDAVVLCDGRPYGARVWVGSNAWSEHECEPDDIERASDTPVCVPLVWALGTIERAELESLVIGDAFMPGSGWMVRADGTGFAALAAPGAETGAMVELLADRSIVIRGDRVSLAADAKNEEVPMADPEGLRPRRGRADPPEGHVSREEREEISAHALSDVVLEAPIVVRVEVGSVSLTAREWSRLGPGDVISTGARIADPVVLRVAGREVARGELVNVEGEVGVRIQEILRSGGA